jgi:hypothetical protein
LLPLFNAPRFPVSQAHSTAARGKRQTFYFDKPQINRLPFAFAKRRIARAAAPRRKRQRAHSLSTLNLKGKPFIWRFAK